MDTLMLEHKRDECTNYSFRLAGGLLCHCGVPFGHRYRNVPCYHMLCQTCVRRRESQDKCLMCEAHVEKVEELHPNEDVVVCTVPQCGQAFLNFPSLKAHAKLSHSVDVETADEFYHKFGDVNFEIARSHTVSVEDGGFKNMEEKRPHGDAPPSGCENEDSIKTKAPKPS